MGWGEPHTDPLADLQAAMEAGRASLGQPGQQARLVIPRWVQDQLDALTDEQRALIDHDLTLIAHRFGLRVPVLIEVVDP